MFLAYYQQKLSFVRGFDSLGEGKKHLMIDFKMWE